MNAAKHIDLCVDTGVSLPGESPMQIGADIIFVPESLRSPAIVLFCLPGGGMSRRFFDLKTDDDLSYSFAEAMAQKGFVVALIDHPGVGESSQTRDVFLLVPALLARAHANALDEISRQLRTGQIAPDLPPLDDFVSIGVGHSMGAVLTIFLQAHYRRHRALVLLGFGVNGLPELLNEEACSLAGDRAAIDRNLDRLARLHFGEGGHAREVSPELREKISVVKAERKGIEALKKAQDTLLPACAFFSLIPQSLLPEVKQIDVPVFLGNGDFDFIGPAEELPENFSASPDVTHVVLPNCGHSVFPFAARTELFERLGPWIVGQS